MKPCITSFFLVLYLVVLCRSTMGNGFECTSDVKNDTSSSDFCKYCSGNLTMIDGRPKERSDHIRWLHIPKTGTSFGNTVFHVACSALPHWASMPDASHTDTSVLVPYFEKCFPRTVPKHCRFLADSFRLNVAHHPLQPKEVGTMDEVNFVTMLRDPLDRLISGYHNGMHDCTHCKQVRAQHNRTVPLLEYVLHQPGPAGCMTRMLLGKNCEGHYPSKADVENALIILKKFYFVGIVEKWQESICTTFLKVGVRDQWPSEIHFYNVRPGPKRRSINTTLDRENLLLHSKEHGHVDWADELIYNEGKKMFMGYKGKFCD